MKEYIVRIEHGADGAVHYFRTGGEIVRCKECQYRASSFCTCSHRDTDQFFYPEVNPSDYCSYGKRRTDETD